MGRPSLGSKSAWGDHAYSCAATTAPLAAGGTSDWQMGQRGRVVGGTWGGIAGSASDGSHPIRTPTTTQKTKSCVVMGAQMGYTYW
jgi:hypothetical protein